MLVNILKRSLLEGFGIDLSRLDRILEKKKKRKKDQARYRA